MGANSTLQNSSQLSNQFYLVLFILFHAFCTMTNKNQNKTELTHSTLYRQADRQTASFFSSCKSILFDLVKYYQHNRENMYIKTLCNSRQSTWVSLALRQHFSIMPGITYSILPIRRWDSYEQYVAGYFLGSPGTYILYLFTVPSWGEISISQCSPQI